MLCSSILIITTIFISLFYPLFLWPWSFYSACRATTIFFYFPDHSCLLPLVLFDDLPFPLLFIHSETLETNLIKDETL